MGGNAINGAARLGKTEYFHLWGKISTIATTENPFVKLVRSYRSKDTFGDMDILVSGSERFLKAIRNHFEVVEVIENGPVTSVGIITDNRIFQVDLIETPVWKMEIASVYFDFNDLGNLMGRVAHAMGLKYGHDGLWYVVRDGDQVLDTVFLHDDPETIFTHLGFSWEWYSDGFDKLEDIFEFVTCSDFFSADLYPLEHRSHKARVRDAKRATYRAFLNHIQDHHGWRHRVFDKEGLLSYHILRFPELKDEIDRLNAEKERRAAIKAKFNGNIAKELTNLSGKELGIFIDIFRDRYSDEWILSNTADDCANAIVELNVELNPELGV